MAHRVRDQTYIRLFIINGLLKYHIGKVVPKAVHGGLLARCGFPPLRSLAAVRLRVSYSDELSIRSGRNTVQIEIPAKII